MVGVRDIVKGIINDYKVKVEVFVKVYSKMINKKNAIFIKN